MSLPLLVLAASVSGESLAHLGAGLLVILICSGTYRMIGITLLTMLERDEFILFIIPRIVFVFFMVTGWLVPVPPLLNPVLAFVDAGIWPQHLGALQFPGVVLHGWVATVVLHLLLAGLFFIIATIRVHWVQRRAIALTANERDPGSG